MSRKSLFSADASSPTLSVDTERFSFGITLAAVGMEFPLTVVLLEVNPRLLGFTSKSCAVWRASCSIRPRSFSINCTSRYAWTRRECVACSSSSSTFSGASSSAPSPSPARADRLTSANDWSKKTRSKSPKRRSLSKILTSVSSWTGSLVEQAAQNSWQVTTSVLGAFSFWNDLRLLKITWLMRSIDASSTSMFSQILPSLSATAFFVMPSEPEFSLTRPRRSINALL
mmetsp:Transcript_45325/g.106055  ORF Transcript_45325/g.106055 Transcript_45325/m.106055 type:complete len:228 (-) Transcript_45325:1304-1987(-)